MDTSRPADDVAIEVIDDEGDVKYCAGDSAFLVSSKLLSLASPVFKAQFYGGFSEACVDKSPANPLTIREEDGDPEALGILLHILHFSRKRKFDTISAPQLLQVAKLADKFLCRDAISAQAHEWIRSTKVDETDLPNTLRLCITAYLMRFQSEFATYLTRLCSFFSAERLEAVPNIDDLPEYVYQWQEVLKEKRLEILNEMIGKVQSVMGAIVRQPGFRRTSYKLCKHCKARQPASTARCICNNNMWWDDLCSPGLRLQHFLEEITALGYWPLIPKSSWSPLTFQSGLKLKLHERHGCDAGAICELFEDTKGLTASLGELVRRDKVISPEEASGLFPENGC